MNLKIRAAFDPVRGKTTTLDYLLKIPKVVNPVFHSGELGEEARAFNSSDRSSFSIQLFRQIKLQHSTLKPDQASAFNSCNQIKLQHSTLATRSSFSIQLFRPDQASAFNSCNQIKLQHSTIASRSSFSIQLLQPDQASAFNSSDQIKLQHSILPTRSSLSI